MPDRLWIVHCFHASTLTPKKEKDRENLSDVKTLDCYWRATRCVSRIKQHLIIWSPSELQKQELWIQTVLFFVFLFGKQSACWWSQRSRTSWLTQVIICSAWSVYNVWQSAVPRCYLFLLDLPCFDSVWERNTLWGVRWRLYVTDLEGKIKRRQTGS